MPDVDVPVSITGIRPGEKLFGQLAYDSEDMFLTPHESIRIWHTPPSDAARIRQILSTLDRLYRNDTDGGDDPERWR